MTVTISKWGNSLRIEIPQDIAKKIDLVEGSEVDLEIVGGKLIIQPSKRKHYTLNQLVEGITSENCHQEINTGNTVGNEIW